MRSFCLGIFSLVISLLAACSLISSSPIKAQLSNGQSIYEQGCAIPNCHGENGEGIRNDDSFLVWPLVGEEFQRRNPNAQVIFDVIRSGGEAFLRALTDQQIYDAIAYELSLNDVDLSEPITVRNAAHVSSGKTAEEQRSGTIYPPPGNTRFISTWTAPNTPTSVDNSLLRMRLTQIALASSIGEKTAPGGSNYMLVVFSLEALTDQTIEVGPQYIRLMTGDGQMLEPLEVNLDYPVARFYRQAITFEHGTAALAVFSMPVNSHIDHLLYMWPSEDSLVLDLTH